MSAGGLQRFANGGKFAGGDWAHGALISQTTGPVNARSPRDLAFHSGLLLPGLAPETQEVYSNSLHLKAQACQWVSMLGGNLSGYKIQAPMDFPLRGVRWL